MRTSWFQVAAQYGKHVYSISIQGKDCKCSYESGGVQATDTPTFEDALWENLNKVLSLNYGVDLRAFHDQLNWAQLPKII
jgi:hypothetical protein